MKEFTLSNINSENACKCYNQLVKLYADFKNVEFENINIKLNAWFSANMSAVLGAILDKLSLINSISVISDNSQIISILQKNNFLANYGYQTSPDLNDTTIKYLKLKPSESRYFYFYVINKLLSHPELPDMSNELKKKIYESIYEIFVNAQIHSNTDYIYTCGQFFPNKHTIEFTIVDTGVGFKKVINDRFNYSLSSIKAIKWALQDGNTTKKDTGGLGLTLLTEFIKLNKGAFQIVSDDGFYEVGETENTAFLTSPFPGTIVNMKFRTDDRNSYRLASEKCNLDDIF